MITRNERFLAALIFVLWSFGVVVLPALSQSGVFNFANGVPVFLLWAYLLLHAVILVYALSLLGQLLRQRKPRKRRAYVIGLYIYAVLMLMLSMYLISRGLWS